MSVDPNLLEILVCPECKGHLLELENSLACRRCHLQYPVDKNGVPHLLADEAEIYEPDDTHTKKHK